MKIKKPSKSFTITIIIVVIVILGWAGLTKAGYIENYLEIGFLCSKQKNIHSILDNKNKGSNNSITDWKPVIYLYPKQSQKVKVELDYSGQLLVSYPEYNNGWNVLANPDGRIVNLADNKEYSYLFWEGRDATASYDLSSGFVVKGDDSVGFLQEKLSLMGLTPKEYNEFIVYWYPKMMSNKYNLVHFATQAEYADKVKLNIEPRPDSILRVFMVFKPLDNPIAIQEQPLSGFNRLGFSVIEWGGTELN